MANGVAGWQLMIAQIGILKLPPALELGHNRLKTNTLLNCELERDKKLRPS